jgi:hypothetical protein
MDLSLSSIPYLAAHTRVVAFKEWDVVRRSLFSGILR